MPTNLRHSSFTFHLRHRKCSATLSHWLCPGWPVLIVHLRAFWSLMRLVSESSLRVLLRCCSTNPWLCTAVCCGRIRPQFWSVPYCTSFDSSSWWHTLIVHIVFSARQNTKCVVNESLNYWMAFVTLPKIWLSILSRCTFDTPITDTGIGQKEQGS